MFAAQERALNHRGSAISSTNHDHYDVLETSGRSSVRLSQQGYPLVVFNLEADAKRRLAPSLQIKLGCLVVFDV